MENPIASLRVTDLIDCPRVAQYLPNRTRQGNTRDLSLRSILDSSTVGIATALHTRSVTKGHSVDVKMGLTHMPKQMIQLCR